MLWNNMKIRHRCQYFWFVFFMIAFKSDVSSSVLINESHILEGSVLSVQAEKKGQKKIDVRSMDVLLNPNKCLFIDMLNFYLKALALEKETIHFYSLESKEYSLLGLARAVGNGYQVLLKETLNPVELRVTLAHELVHIKQLKEGRVKKEHFKRHYYDRPFEQEAFEKSFYLAIKFYTELHC